MQNFLLRAFACAILLTSAPDIGAHSGKARFHIIIDTGFTADGLRSVCMLLGNREAEVLAITTAGTFAADSGQIKALLQEFNHQGIPVGSWFGRGSAETGDYPAAAQLISSTLSGEEEKVTIVALGALTNIADALAENPALNERIDKIVWYCPTSERNGANYRSDTLAARQVLDNGVPTVIVSVPSYPVMLSGALVDSIAEVGTVYSDKIASSLTGATEENRLQRELAALYLFAPELFSAETVSPTVTLCELSEGNEAQVGSALLAILRGKPDAESRVFYGFPTAEWLYAADVEPIIRQTIERYGASEWRAGVLTNELHGHLGIYATIGVKMGIRAREYFNIGVDDIEVVSFAGSRPPVSCMNDGLQVSTGATIGHGLIRVADNAVPRPEAQFCFKGKCIRLTLKKEIANRISADVRKAETECGGLTEEYWLKIRRLALQYWLCFDRNEIFDLQTENGNLPAERETM